MNALVKLACFFALTTQSLLAKAPPVTMPTPSGFKTETIPFPLSFAPKLSYTGFEELRFAPGMFKAEAPDYFSYSFIWSVEENLPLDPKQLTDDLLVYFEGLGQAVLKSKKLPAQDFRLRGALRKVRTTFESPEHLVGQVEAFDAFAALKKVKLYVSIYPVPTQDSSGTVLYFALSPQPFDHAIWEKLTSIRRGTQTQ